MRLIDVRTLEIKTFGDKPPPYAILSHRWGAEEVTYQEFVAHQKQNGKGYQKILDFCRTVQEIQLSSAHQWQWMTDSEEQLVAADESSMDCEDQFPWLEEQYVERAVKWAWIDTCCVDKTSSAELSEAINSMWHYYRGAAYCIAYLEDVSSLYHINDMYKSEWFTRGWTLQELLAPRLLAFCSSDWSRIGSMRDSAVVPAIVTRVTGIHTKYLTNHNSISNASVARRMSWAARRKTTREEDMAYCLMGLFNVHMSLLYGEGGRNAFYRLQKKIIKQSNDESIFAFNANHIGGILAARPTAFRDSGPVRQQLRVTRPPYAITHKGLQIESPAILITGGPWEDCFLIKLNCVFMLELPTYEAGVQVSPGVSRWCVLGVERVGDVFVRRSRLEKAAIKWTTTEVKRNLEAKHWKRTESKRFLIALSDDSVSELLKYHDSGPAEESLEPPPPRCVDLDGPWFSGVETHPTNDEVGAQRAMHYRMQQAPDLTKSPHRAADRGSWASLVSSTVISVNTHASPSQITPAHNKTRQTVTQPVSPGSNFSFSDFAWSAPASILSLIGRLPSDGQGPTARSSRCSPAARDGQVE